MHSNNCSENKKRMNEPIHYTARERRSYFWYLLLLVVFVALALGWLLFTGVSNPFSMERERDPAFLAQQRIFEQQEETALRLYDSGFAKIDRYRIAPSNVLEAEIKEDIGLLNSLYDTSARSDPRSLSFQQMGAFLEMYLTDVIQLQKSLTNGRLFEQQLADCRMGLDRRGEQIRAATPTRQ